MTEQTKPYELDDPHNTCEETPEDLSMGGAQDDNEGGTQDEGIQDKEQDYDDDGYNGLFGNVSDYDGERDSDGYPEDGKTSESGRSTPVETPSTIEDIALEVHAVLYSKSGDKMYIIKKHYDSSAVFQDPLAIAEGHENICLQFELLSSLVTDLTTQFSAVTVSSRLSQAKKLVIIDAIVNCHFMFFKRLSLRSTTMFVFDDRQKIVSHEDVWSVSDLIKNIPIIGWIYGNIGRKVGTLAINQLYSICKSVC